MSTPSTLHPLTSRGPWEGGALGFAASTNPVRPGTPTLTGSQGDSVVHELRQERRPDDRRLVRRQVGQEVECPSIRL